MKRLTRLKAGYRIKTNLASMTVRKTGDGTTVSIFYRQKQELHTTVFDKDGNPVDCKVTPEVQERFSRMGRVACRILRKSFKDSIEPPTKSTSDAMQSDLAFSFRYRSGDREGDHALTLGGFTDGQSVYVLYQIKAGERLYAANQLKIDGDRSLVGAQIPESKRLSPERFREVCDLGLDQSFALGGKTYRRLSNEELTSLIVGQTIVIDPPLIG